MSQWRMTAWDAELNREITTIVLTPDYTQDETPPFPGYLLIADQGREAEWFSLHTALEVGLCKQQSLAAVCLPGWILQTEDPLRYITEVLPARYPALLPVSLRWIHGEGTAAAWIEANKAALSSRFGFDCPY